MQCVSATIMGQSVYEALDSFLNVATWHTSHDYDLERFYKALDKIVSNPAFNADQIGEYIKGKFPERFAADDAEMYWDPIKDDLVQKAWAVRDYLKFTGKL